MSDDLDSPSSPEHHLRPALQHYQFLLGVANICALLSCAVQVVGGDLDTPSSLEPHLARVSSIYCHALSGDAASADPAELARGQALAQLAGRYRDQLRLVVYNSSAGRGSNAGISQVGGSAVAGKPWRVLGALLSGWWSPSRLRHQQQQQHLIGGCGRCARCLWFFQVLQMDHQVAVGAVFVSAALPSVVCAAHHVFLSA